MAEAAAHTLVARSVPTGSAAAVAAAGPMAGFAAAALAAGRRIAGVPGARRGCIGAAPDYMIGLIAVGDRTVAVGTIRGGVPGAGTTGIAGCCRTIAEATCRAVVL